MPTVKTYRAYLCLCFLVTFVLYSLNEEKFSTLMLASTSSGFYRKKKNIEN